MILSLNTIIGLIKKYSKGSELPKLDAIEPLADDADLVGVIVAFNGLISDLKAKGYMN